MIVMMMAFMLSVAGASTMTAIPYKSMSDCNRDLETIINEVKTSEYITEDGTALKLIAVTCTETIKSGVLL